MPALTILFILNSHTAADHIFENDRAKFLSHQKESLIATAVKLSPLQTSGELILNVQDSPTKHIDAKLKKLVTHLVHGGRTSTRFC